MHGEIIIEFVMAELLQISCPPPPPATLNHYRVNILNEIEVNS